MPEINKSSIIIYNGSECMSSPIVVNTGRISSLKKRSVDNANYLVIDIETFKYEEYQLPYSIAVKGANIYKLLHLHTYINMFFNVDIKGLSNNMIYDIIKYLLDSYKSNLYIYAHNLGGFDGYFILKVLIKMVNYKDINLIMDDSKRIIELRYKNLIFRDSYRIFPESLNKLAEITLINRPKLEFDYNVCINKILNKEFYDLSIKYLENDVLMLFNIISVFKENIIRDYNLPLYKVYSTSNLAFKVFRTNFLKENLHSTTIKEYTIIKPAYYGGSVEIYNNSGNNLYYYDVNSLYPYAMLKPLPIQYIKTIENLSMEEFIKNDYFGFVDCIITIDKNIDKPRVPVRQDLRIIFPTGIIKGRYFSEEVKS